jgi:predicted XRE-type DNA-binding protein
MSGVPRHLALDKLTFLHCVFLMPREIDQPTDRQVSNFWKKVRKTPTCWVWLGCKSPLGYGVFMLGGRTVRASRFMMLLEGRLVTELDCCHDCNNPSCVNPGHLRMDTKVGNMRDCVDAGTHNRGERCGAVKLTEKQVIKIFGSDLPNRDLAKKYRVSSGCIRGIKSKRNWQHLGLQSAAVSKNLRYKLTKADVLEIRESRLKQRELADKFGVVQQTISDIKRFRSWKCTQTAR